jgi:succinoglycan biosynthesis protein ExoM
MGDGGADAAVDVCVCTFRRASLRRTLESLAAQQGAATFRVIVADNDEAPSAQALVEQARGDLGLDIAYVHAPARNISIARNACLDAARAPLIAFIDDDEIAPPRWLNTLASGLGDHDIVFGPVRAIYAPDAPRWVVRGDFHSFGPVVRANGAIDTGYSSNVLMRRAAIENVRFEPALGRTGGEDTFFFARLHRAGAKLGACAEAFVEEPTAPERARLSWLVRRAFRAGQTHARVLHDRRQGALAIAAPAAAKVLYCTVSLVLTLLSPADWRRNAIRGALHCGVIAKALGARDLELYG